MTNPDPHIDRDSDDPAEQGKWGDRDVPPEDRDRRSPAQSAPDRSEPDDPDRRGTRASTAGSARASVLAAACACALCALLLVARSTAGSDYSRCPVTRPPSPAFVPAAPYPPEPESSTFWYGSKAFWTRLRADGHAGRRDRIFWWRSGYDGTLEQRPNLVIVIKPFANGIGILENARASNAFSDGAWSMLTSVDFPEAGCWTVTGTYAGRSLTFVTSVQ